MSDNLGNHPSSRLVKMLNVGENGSGKTGALAALALAGYNLHILDFDNGLDILANLLRPHPEALARVRYKTLRDVVSMSAGIPRVKAATAWKAAGQTLNDWGVSAFTEKDVVVCDTLSTMSQYAFNQSLALNGRLNTKSHESDYGWMADSVLLFIDALTSEDAAYNVIVNTHVRYLRGEEETVQDDKGREFAAGTIAGLPNAKGQMIARDIGKYFNTIVYSTVMGTGPGAKRVITTAPTGVIKVKTSNPLVKKTYPVETGLADLFRDLRGEGTPTLAPNQPKDNSQHG